ncbi:cell division site-positioning protein MapZ family protein [Vagococcus bubulae]|uniref:Uncharacterized protein n=1 Tax=Vagococcus bubulae TaxID=1977868 RepID=A0A429ZRG8_9ENTE|nr:cell division site-positioning protein MapZ family protein [Vagococcus bubulae]RST96296.1 hypothetical protein CBF36_00775 [Vagococcus bubulae]
MTNEVKKCPNCGHIFKAGETYCPNCDLFVPIDKQNNIANDTTEETHQDTTSTSGEQAIPTFKHRTLSSQAHDDEYESFDEEETKQIPVIEEADLVEEDVEEEPYEPIMETPVLPEAEEELVEEIKEQEIEDIEPPIDEPPVSDTRQTPPNKNNKTKILVGIIILLIVFGGGYVYNSQKKQNELETTLKLTTSAENAVDDLFMKNQGDIFLKKDITQSDITTAEDKVKDIKGTEQYDKLNERLQQAIKTFTRLTAINEAFKTPVIEGNQLLSDAYVKDDTKLTLEAIDPEENGFDKLYNEAIKDATDQKSAIKTFKSTLEKLYRDDKVVSEPSKQVYNDAVKQLADIKDPSLKADYQKILDEISNVINTQEKQAEEKRKEEEAKQAETAKAEAEKNNQQAQASDNNNTQSGSSFTPSTNGGRWGTRQDATINLSDPAWAWNPGVQEKVIAEVIKRGYVVEGGYTLVPKFIENGVGFYDLYATTNSKLFPNSKPEEFPIYVVTINDKTGWFKGNGPN